MAINPSWTPVGGQEGLYIEQKQFKVGGLPYFQRVLHTSDGYCFYDKTEGIYNEKGELIEDTSENRDYIISHRTYMRTAHLGLAKPLDDFISLPIQERFNIV